MTGRWVPITDAADAALPTSGRAVPNEGEVVDVITPSGEQRPLMYRTNMWWLPDGSMYVYFQPVMWTGIDR